jgi:hypothetical protein
MKKIGDWCMLPIQKVAETVNEQRLLFNQYINRIKLTTITKQAAIVSQRTRRREKVLVQMEISALKFQNIEGNYFGRRTRKRVLTFDILLTVAS